MTDHAEIVMQLTADYIRHNRGETAARRLYHLVRQGVPSACQEHLEAVVTVLQVYMRHSDVDAATVRALGFGMIDPEVPPYALVASVTITPGGLGAEFNFHAWQEHAS